jgi:hypothetical protein
MSTGTPSRQSGQRVQEHVGTHVMQHSSTHGYGDTIPSIRSESTRTRGNTRDKTGGAKRHMETIHQGKLEMWAKTGFYFWFVLSQTNKGWEPLLFRIILRIANLLIANLLSGNLVQVR